ncbi:MAG TPA: hypothetical protein DD379_24585 [Cyanobacteria bacterium UBA11162]|nr:hypothetical protein [Cyanobacteria bacterium UBA11162]
MYSRSTAALVSWFVIGCWLLVIGCWLLVVKRLLPIQFSLQPITHSPFLLSQTTKNKRPTTNKKCNKTYDFLSNGI